MKKKEEKRRRRKKIDILWQREAKNNCLLPVEVVEEAGWLRKAEAKAKAES